MFVSVQLAWPNIPKSEPRPAIWNKTIETAAQSTTVFIITQFQIKSRIEDTLTRNTDTYAIRITVTDHCAVHLETERGDESYRLMLHELHTT